jgi:hypothetical protein
VQSNDAAAVMHLRSVESIVGEESIAAAGDDQKIGMQEDSRNHKDSRNHR